MAFNSIPDALITVGKAWTRLISKVYFKDNLDDLNTRLAAAEAALGKIPIVSKIIDLENARVGEVRWSFLTAVQFQARYGTDWVQIAGQSIAGKDLASLYGATLPDGRDRFPRILASGGKSIGDKETSRNKQHDHNYSDPGHAHDAEEDAVGGAVTSIKFDNSAFISNANIPTPRSGPIASNTTGVNFDSDGGTDARPDSLVLSTFVKQNDMDLNRVYISKALLNMTVVSTTISNLTAGSSGTLSIDVLKGTSLGSLSSMLTGNLSLTAASGDDATSGEASYDDDSLDQNDFLVVDVNATQVAQHSFFLSMYGESI